MNVAVIVMELMEDAGAEFSVPFGDKPASWFVSCFASIQYAILKLPQLYLALESPLTLGSNIRWESAIPKEVNIVV